MVRVVFYEKPGCSSNSRQKQLLRAAGADLEVRNLLTQAWKPDALRAFFGDKPVSDWFNRNAPRVKSGALDPASTDVQSALAAMQAEPLLIRRPLIESGDLRECGFDWPALAQQLGLVAGDSVIADTENCKHGQHNHQCGSNSNEGTAGATP